MIPRGLTRRACLAAGAALFAQELPTIKVKVRLVRLLVTVKDPKGNPIGSLKKEDFAVTDLGVRQEIAVFERSTAQPLSVSLLIDNSLSTVNKLEDEARAVRAFLTTLFGEGNQEDRAALYTFHDEVRMEANFTRNLPRLMRPLARLKAMSGTSLYDALWFAAHDIERRDGRKVIIVVTDGGDTTSAKKYREALEAVQRADCVIYPILIRPITQEVGRNVGGENALATMAADTGGRIFQPALGKELDQTFATILSDLRTQYLIGYYPRELPVDAKPFHPVRVQLTGATVPAAGLQLLTRSGYYGDAD